MGREGHLKAALRGCSSVVEHLLAKERVEFESLHPLKAVIKVVFSVHTL